MAGAKEIRTQIASIKNTQKITGAMQMVAASKMRRAQDRMQASRPYTEKMRQVIAHLGHAHPEYRHPFMDHKREAKRVGYIVVSSDRGLCGGLNNNLFRKLAKEIKAHMEAGRAVEFCTIGTKALVFFRRFGGQRRLRQLQRGDREAAGADVDIREVQQHHRIRERVRPPGVRRGAQVSCAAVRG